METVVGQTVMVGFVCVCVRGEACGIYIRETPAMVVMLELGELGGIGP